MPGQNLDTSRSLGRAAQTWSYFLKQLQGQGGLARDLAERAASSVMCALEQRLCGTQSPDDPDSQLPQRLRELLRRCESHPEGAAPMSDKEAFLGMIALDLGVETDEAEHLARVVFDTVRGWLTDGEADEVADQLPQDLRDLWAPLQ